MPHHDTGETSRPVVYLDVDGVLNAIGGHHAFGDSTGAVVEGFTLTLSPALGGRLNRWNAEIRWLTTWGHRANAVGRLIGLPHRAVAAVPPAGADAAGTWKLDAVRHEIERTPRPFVWIDDTAINRHAERWAEDQRYRYLLVRPTSAVGLSPAEVDHIESWLAELA